ncbi:hypothetical protein DdX_13743 [Ditylenchus destructor]|uniref:Uncharacterized protein n=1 Tax=Ditylenchus destructor TaxID=166010 RepID=A0AAD4MT42_9BILA|nr:hypothetical protein DdX_13743 [Ditylenchus destructor]
MTEPLKFFKVDHTTIYQDGFSYSFYRDLDPPKSSADLQLHQSFHCALRTQEQNCRSRCHVTGNWQMDKKGSKFMLGIVKKADHTHGPEYRDTTPKFKFYKNDFESLHRNGFVYTIYRELDPPKQIADLQWHEAYHCSMSDQENCRARIYTTGQWEKNKREMEYQNKGSNGNRVASATGIFKNCIHSHGSEQDSKEEDKENSSGNIIVAPASSSTHTKNLEKKEQIRFYKYKGTRVHHSGFVYCYDQDLKSHPKWKHRMYCQRVVNGKKSCKGYIWTSGKWDKESRGREYQIGIIMDEHNHDPYKISFQGKDNDDEVTEAGSKFYQYKGKMVYRDGFVYCVENKLKSRPPWKLRMQCNRLSKTFHCKGSIWTTDEWETDKLGRVYQRGIQRGGHSHDPYEQFFNEDDTAHVGSPMNDKQSLDEDDVVMIEV